MQKISFNDRWKCFKKGEDTKSFQVTIPHDAMLLDEKTETSPGGVNTGWYDACDYTYEKTFMVPEEYKGNKILLEFEGVYHKATVSLNGRKAAFHNYGYTGFYVDATRFLKFGEENRIRVDAVNSDQPNSRWYSGTGIYRPVWLYILPQKHIIPEGIKITTLNYGTKEIKVEAETSHGGIVTAEILDGKQIIAQGEFQSGKNNFLKLKLSEAKLWDPQSPSLYTCRVTYGEDIQEVRFGIRQLEWSSENGFCINGNRVILRGACIHHDNGLLGACAYDFSERRKIRILKECGYNAVRSAHNPCSKAMLDACDELGMLMMDEYVDVWYIHKSKYDYAGEVEKHYKEDLKAMVEKDYNHPSVIMYSTGNEVSETAQKRGVALCGDMTQYLHEQDPTRPVTCGVNIFFNFLSSMGFGVYSDKKADQAAENAKKKKAVGSEFFNNLAGLFGSEFMKFGATLYPCDVKTRDAFARMDIAGYNYGINRYQHDLKKYPDRLILGSETFCSDAARFWDLARDNKRIIGDFVWAGMDYLGEVAIGSWEYSDYAKRFDGGKGWVSAGSGRIDLTGKPLSEMKYTRVAFGLDKIGIGVVPVNHTGDRHSPSAWKMSNAQESWTWEGCEGKEALVEVYTRADSVALFVNGTCAGRKRISKDCKVTFKTLYKPGELKAEGYDASGNCIASEVLYTAGEETVLLAEPEDNRVDLQGGLAYVRFRYTDSKGNLKPLARGKIQLEIQGGKLLGFGSGCPYYPDGYLNNWSDTYYGEAMAIIAPDQAGKLKVNAGSPYGCAEVEIEVV